MEKTRACTHESFLMPSNTSIGRASWHTCGTARRPHLRRLLLEDSKCHLYFVVDQKNEVLTIVDVWNGQRGRPPKL